MSSALTCVPCGAAVPAGRQRCGRCGAPVTAAARKAATAEPVAGVDDSGSGGSRRALVIGALALTSAVAIPLLMGTPRTGAAIPAPAAAAMAGETGTASITADTPSYTPSGVFAASDANRGGTAAYANGDIGSAESQYRAAVVADPDNSEALNNLGQVLVRNGDARGAIEFFDRAIAASPDIWAYHFNRARAYGEIADWPEAIDGYEDAARLFPGDYVTQFNLARAREQYGDLPGAISGYARAIELAPSEADFRLWYGQALDKNGQDVEAAAAYRDYLELAPESPRAEQVKSRLAQLTSSSEAVS